MQLVQIYIKNCNKMPNTANFLPFFKNIFILFFPLLTDMRAAVRCLTWAVPWASPHPASQPGSAGLRSSRPPSRPRGEGRPPWGWGVRGCRTSLCSCNGTCTTAVVPIGSWNAVLWIRNDCIPDPTPDLLRVPVFQFRIRPQLFKHVKKIVWKCLIYCIYI